MKNKNLINKIVNISIATLGMGMVFLPIIASASPATQVSNTATVTSNTTDTNLANNTATAIDKLCAEADLEVISLSDGVTTINASAANVYTTVIANNGPSKVTQIVYVLNYNNVFVNAPVITSSNGTYSQTAVSTAGSVTTVTGTVVFATDLLPTQNVSIFATTAVKPNAVNGQIYNASTTATPNGPNFDECNIVDPDLNNNGGSDDTTMSTVADLAITKISSGGGNSTTNAIGTIYAGSTVAYTLGVVNNGPSTAAANITVVDTMPSQVTPIIASGANYTASLDWTCTFVSPTMTCINTNPMLNGASSSIVINSNVTSTL